MRVLAAYLIGWVFGLGIVLSGMSNPAKILNFLDLAGSWDPSLAFVMGGALLVTFLGYRMVLARPSPVLAQRFQLPTSTRIDSRLLGGAALFGLGWGVSGFCPGGAIPALGTGRPEVFLFVVALLLGIWVTRHFAAAKPQTAPPNPDQTIDRGLKQ